MNLSFESVEFIVVTPPCKYYLHDHHFCCGALMVFVCAVMPGGGSSSSNISKKKAQQKRDNELGIGNLTKGSRRNMLREQAGLKVGTPLPAKGACEHYRRSYRWLRYDTSSSRTFLFR
jgi:hypothetical protein